jgi:hypothetical protein
MLLCARCENLVTNLPETDTAQYISGNTVNFPKGTKAIDIYNTVVFLHNDSAYFGVDGKIEYWKDLTQPKLVGDENNNGIEDEGETHELITKELIIDKFTKIKHTHTESGGDIHTHTVYLETDAKIVKELVFKWQRQTTNVWKNDVITEDKISFTK